MPPPPRPVGVPAAACVLGTGGGRPGEPTALPTKPGVNSSSEEATASRVFVSLWLVPETRKHSAHLFAPPCRDVLIDQPGAINCGSCLCNPESCSVPLRFFLAFSRDLRDSGSLSQLGVYLRWGGGAGEELRPRSSSHLTGIPAAVVLAVWPQVAAGSSRPVFHLYGGCWLNSAHYLVRCSEGCAVFSG